MRTKGCASNTTAITRVPNGVAAGSWTAQGVSGKKQLPKTSNNVTFAARIEATDATMTASA
jgi:hypothetical protein